MGWVGRLMCAVERTLFGSGTTRMTVGEGLPNWQPLFVYWCEKDGCDWWRAACMHDLCCPVVSSEAASRRTMTLCGGSGWRGVAGLRWWPPLIG